MRPLTHLEFLLVRIGAKIKKITVLCWILFSIFSNPSYALTVGESSGGGTVFCVSQQASMAQCAATGSGPYGLIMANVDQAHYNSNPNHGVSWCSTNSASTGTSSSTNGAANTARIIAALPNDTPTNNAAWLCHNYRDLAEHNDWYLPSQYELNLLYIYARTNNLIGINCTGEVVGGMQCLVGRSDGGNNIYWSSTEYNGEFAWVQAFGRGGDKAYSYKERAYLGVRAIRAATNSETYQYDLVGRKNSVVPFTAIDFTRKFSEHYGYEVAKIKILSLPSKNDGILRLGEAAVSLKQEILHEGLGNLTFTPPADWTGATSFSLNGYNGTLTNSALINIIIRPAPTITPVTKAGFEDTVLTFTPTDFISSFRGFQGRSLVSVAILSLPNHGTLKLADSIVTLNQVLPVESLGELRYEPFKGYLGVDSFSWNGSDGALFAIDSAKVNITINDRAPTLTDLAKVTYKNSELNFAALDFSSNFNDFHGRSLVEVAILTLPAHGTLQLAGTPVTLNQVIPVSELGNLTYTPSEGYLGSDSFRWNGSNGSWSAAHPASVNLTINDRVPTLTDLSKTTYQNTELAFAASDFSSNFVDFYGRNLVSVQILSLPLHGTLKLADTAVALNQIIPVGELANLTYQPFNDYLGSDSFRWNGSDGIWLAASSAQVVLTINESASSLGPDDPAEASKAWLIPVIVAPVVAGVTAAVTSYGIYVLHKRGLLCFKKLRPTPAGPTMMDLPYSMVPIYSPASGAPPGGAGIPFSVVDLVTIPEVGGLGSVFAVGPPDD